MNIFSNKFNDINYVLYVVYKNKMKTKLFYESNKHTNTFFKFSIFAKIKNTKIKILQKNCIDNSKLRSF